MPAWLYTIQALSCERCLQLCVGYVATAVGVQLALQLRQTFLQSPAYMVSLLLLSVVCKAYLVLHVYVQCLHQRDKLIRNQLDRAVRTVAHDTKRGF